MSNLLSLKKSFVKSTTYLVISLVKVLLSRYFCQKNVRVIFWNFHTKLFLSPNLFRLIFHNFTNFLGPGAGTSIVSFDAQTGSVHVNLLLSGIFQTDGEKNVGLLVKFEFVHEGETRTIEETLNVDKVDNVSTSIFKYRPGQPNWEFWKFHSVKVIQF